MLFIIALIKLLDVYKFYLIFYYQGLYLLLCTFGTWGGFENFNLGVFGSNMIP